MAYLTTKLPNFTQGSFVTIGGYIALTMARLWGITPYYAMGLSFVISGVAALLMYRLALRPQIKRGASLTSLMVTTVAVWILFTGLINIYADYLQFTLKIPGGSRGFLLMAYDFTIAGEPALLVVSVILGIVLISGLFVLLTKTDFGIGLRATAENITLAEAIGIDTDRVTDFSWFLSGALSGVAGALASMWFYSSTTIGDFLFITMVAASMLGGLGSIFGAIFGGYVIGAVQLLGTNMMADYLGSWIIAYQLLIPLVVLVLVLLFIPRGLASLDWQRLLRRRANK